MRTAVGPVALAHDGARFATGGYNAANAIGVWDRVTFERVARLRGHRKFIAGLAFADDGGQLVSSSADGTVALWDLARAECVVSHQLGGRVVIEVACHGSGSSLLVAAGTQGGTLCLWEPHSDTAPRALRGAGGSVNAVAFAPNGEVLVTGGGVERGEFGVQVRDASTGDVIQTLPNRHSDWPLWAGFSPTGDLLATGSYGEICLWDTESWTQCGLLRRPETEHFSTVGFAFTADPGTFVSGGWSHEQDLRAGRGVIQIWDLETGRLRASTRAHDRAIRSIAVAPTEPLLVTTSADRTARVWKLPKT